MASTAAAQSLQIPAAPQAQPTAIVNATIHPIVGPDIPHGYVLFERGVITAVAAGDPTPIPRPDWLIHDARGLHVYPGLISAETTLGLTEIEAARATNDLSEVGSITSEVFASVAVNPDTALIPVTRANGILTACVVPQGGLISGYASLVRLDGWTTEEMTLVDRAGLVVRWPNVLPQSGWWVQESEEEQLERVRENLDRIDVVFRDAAAYLQARRADDEFPVDLRLEDFRPVLEQGRPLFVYANNAPAIRSAVAWADRMNLGIVLVGGHQADRCVDVLKASDVPVVVVGTHRMPTRDDAPFDEPFTLPLRLHEAGVRFCLASGESAAHERSLPYHAGKAVAYGLPRDVALRSITLNAAEILGLGRTHGSIETGKAASLILTDGDPLEITTTTLHAYIDGSAVDLDSKHKALDRKYRTRYGPQDGE